MLNQETTSAKTSASSVFLWLRPDLKREDARAYWAGPHSQLVSRTPGFLEYRQHHFTTGAAGLWPAIDGVETSIPDERRIDGMPEVTFEHAWSPLLGGKQNKEVHQDERNVFERTILHITGPGGGRWFKTGYGEHIGARTVILLRRRETSKKAFKSFVHEAFGPALNRAEVTLELRTQTFLPFRKSMWDTPDVAHDYPADKQFHASIVLGAADRQSLELALASVNEALAAELRKHCMAVHAYDVEQTYAYVRDGRPALPQVRPERKPRLDPVMRRDIPKPTPRAEQSTGDAPFPSAKAVPLSGSDPEDVVIDDQGRAICGVSGGRILRVDVERGTIETIGDTGGRPLGLELQADGKLIVCDAHRGLLRLDPSTGEIEELVRLVNEVPLRFCSNATAAADGTIWFTESTSRYDFEQFFGALLEHRPSGRLFRRDSGGEVEVVLEDLHFANGITLTEDESAVIFAETGAARISRYEIATGQVDVIAENLPGYPDNVSRLRDGRFWVALTNPRDAGLEKLATAPVRVRKAIWKIPDRFIPEGTKTTWVMAFDEGGNEVADYQDARDDFHMVTGVAEHGGRLILASPQHETLLALDLPTEK